MEDFLNQIMKAERNFFLKMPKTTKEMATMAEILSLEHGNSIWKCPETGKDNSVLKFYLTITKGLIQAIPTYI